MRALTISAMCVAGLVSTIGFSGSTVAPAHAGQATPPIYQAAAHTR
jgi:hypothetical protein